MGKQFAFIKYIPIEYRTSLTGLILLFSLTLWRALESVNFLSRIGISVRWILNGLINLVMNDYD